MTVYPFEIDSDQTIIRIDDNLSEIGGESINQLREAVFAIEQELGIHPAGSAGSIANRLDVSLNPDGTIKASALTSVGLATLPIVDNQVANNAGIKEFKLALDFTTSDLHTLIQSNSALLNSLTTFVNNISSDLNLHIAGAGLLSDGSTSARHVLSHIDVNSVPTDPRDPTFVWVGLKDKTGALRSAVQAAQALQQINDDLTGHENAVTGAHVATAVSVDTTEFTEIPVAANTAQKVFDYLDDAEVLNMGQHRATQHANAIPRITRSQAFNLPDGYRENVVPPTSVLTYLVHAPNTMPVDDLSVGDDLIKFVPTNSNFVFDAQFSQVRVGDIIRVNYGNGVEASFPIESLRYDPATEWIVRINGVNLYESSDGYATARIDRPLYDVDTAGILAVAAANATPTGSFATLLSSVIVGHPRAAMALGLGFDPGQLNSSHYKLYLEMYPTGNPANKVISLPAIDVTGNAGATPGSYTLESVVQEINNNFRQIGYNYRFIAFAHEGEIGIMLADTINSVSFAIISGSNSSGTLITGTFTENVIGGSSLDDFDALGFGTSGSNQASPAFQATWPDETAAQLPTKVIVPLKNRNYIVNGRRRDDFAPTYLANSDGYWDGYISARTPVGLFTVETTYTVNLDLRAAELKPGKTIVIQPTISFSSGSYSDVDYGRFIIKSVNFNLCDCNDTGIQTQITVINGIHSTGVGFGFSSSPSLPVRLYFGEDSVGFNNENVINQIPTSFEFHRLHEIFINEEGKTFSHERARLPRQDETSVLLSTANLHIKNVSPKLRGYRDTDPLVFNKFVRFYVLSYDTTTGEYDGYIGKRVLSSDNIITTGPVTTGRKNVVTKFYDETNIDFVELEFEEVTASPGQSILSTAVPRYVDIELFSSLQPDDELMLLATCEVNWEPAANQDIVQHVIDRRQFGSVDETDFTTSALDFISSSDRLLHSNGVIRGLELDFIGPVVDSGEVFFKGGVAIVNGKIAMVNNMSVTIPQISNVGSGLPQDIVWAVCVNENNDLVPIIVTTTKTQFFATPGSGNYYLPSVTFVELVTTRRDLTPIALVTAHIASLTITDVQDVRRFVSQENLGFELVWASDDIVGHFYSFDAVKEWINRFENKNNLVKVKGAFSLTESLDLTGFTVKVEFVGEGATITTTAPKGVLIGNNVTIRNINFRYAPTGSYSAIVNSDNGCIYALLSTANLSNIKIEGCTFTDGTGGLSRPPFISFQIRKGFILKNLSIIDNIFTDNSSTLFGHCAIVVVHDLLGSGSIPAAVRNLFIERNICENQIILVTSYPNDDSVLTGLGLNIFNGHISDNSCTVIGAINSLTPNTNVNAPNMLTISGNQCKYIAGLEGRFGAMPVFGIAPEYGLGNLTVEGNACHWVHVFCQDFGTTQFADLKIINNSLTGNSYLFLDDFEGDGATSDIAIWVPTGNTSTSERNSFVISNNIINTGNYTSGPYAYKVAGIWVSSSAIISDNIIRGLGTGLLGALSSGIVVDNVGLGVAVPVKHHIVQGNQIYRVSTTIEAYIKVIAGTSTDTGLCVENFFDSTTVDSSSNTTLISGAPIGWIVERNKNQTVTTTVRATTGQWNLNGIVAGTFPTGCSITASEVEPPSVSMTIDYTGGSGNINVFWRVNLFDYLPKNVKITQITQTVQSASAISSTGTYNITLYSRTTTPSSLAAAGANFTGGYVGGTAVTLTITPTNTTSSNTFINSPASKLYVEGFIGITSSGTEQITGTGLTVTYTW